MNTINIKGEAHPKQKGKVKIYFVFHRTDMCRAKKLIDLTGTSKDWDDVFLIILPSCGQLDKGYTS